MQKSFVMGALLMFVVIALLLTALQAGSVSSVLLDSAVGSVSSGNAVYWTTLGIGTLEAPAEVLGGGTAVLRYSNDTTPTTTIDYGVFFHEPGFSPVSFKVRRNVTEPVYSDSCTVVVRRDVFNNTDYNETVCSKVQSGAVSFEKDVVLQVQQETVRGFSLAYVTAGAGETVKVEMPMLIGGRSVKYSALAKPTSESWLGSNKIEVDPQLNGVQYRNSSNFSIRLNALSNMTIPSWYPVYSINITGIPEKNANSSDMRIIDTRTGNFVCFDVMSNTSNSAEIVPLINFTNGSENRTMVFYWGNGSIGTYDNSCPNSMNYQAGVAKLILPDVNAGFTFSGGGITAINASGSTARGGIGNVVMDDGSDAIIMGSGSPTLVFNGNVVKIINGTHGSSGRSVLYAFFPWSNFTRATYHRFTDTANDGFYAVLGNPAGANTVYWRQVAGDFGSTSGGSAVTTDFYGMMAAKTDSDAWAGYAWMNDSQLAAYASGRTQTSYTRPGDPADTQTYFPSTGWGGANLKVALGNFTLYYGVTLVTQGELNTTFALRNSTWVWSWSPQIEVAPASLLPNVNVSIINRTSSNASVILASEHIWGNANYSHASNLPEENSTFKWLTNDTVNGVRTAELKAMIYKGAVGYWHFDSVNGSNVTFDSSGRGNNGNLLGFNQSNATTAGIINSGLQFDGKQDRVIVQDINFNWSASNFTAVLWANMLSPAGVVGGLVSNRDGSGPWWTLGWYEYDVRGEIQVELGNGSAQTYLRSGIYPANKGWQHYALTKSGLTWTLYYNGVLNKTITTAATFTNIGAQTADLAIGRWSGDTQTWNGSIDEVAIYNKTLTAAEIKQLYLRTWYDYSPQLFLLQPYATNATGLNSSDNEKPVTIVGASNATGAFAGTFGVNLTPNGYVKYSAADFNEMEGTIEFWVKPEWNGNDGIFHTFLDTIPDNAMQISKRQTNEFGVYNSNLGVWVMSVDASSWTANVWKHIAVTWNNYSSNYALHVDGVQVANSGTAFMIPSVSSFVIGADSGGLDSWANVTFSEFRISRKALTAQEINLSFSKGRQLYSNEFMLNSSNYVAGDMLKLEYVPRDSAGAVGAVQNSSSLKVHAPKIADESEGDVAIEAGINSSLPSATKYSSRQVYISNLSNNQTLGRFDWVASFGSQRWLINYVTSGEGYVSAPNLTTAVYVLEITGKTTNQITDEVSRLINATKS